MFTVRVESAQSPWFRSLHSCKTQPLAPAGHEISNELGGIGIAVTPGCAANVATSTRPCERWNARFEFPTRTYIERSPSS